jgi:hypothetical protein
VTHLFEVGKKTPETEWEQPGKPEWRDHLLIQLSQRDALQLLTRLAVAIENAGPDLIFSLGLVGEMNEDS